MKRPDSPDMRSAIGAILDTYFSCGVSCSIACLMLRSITARRVSLAGNSFSIISHAATASPKRCCSKALKAYMLRTRTLACSPRTSWRNSSLPDGYHQDRKNGSALPHSPAPHRCFRIQSIGIGIGFSGRTGVTENHANASKHDPAFNICGIGL